MGHLKPLFARSTEIWILAAFVQSSGVERLRDLLDAALDRGAHVRLLTGDYLHLTQARALRGLLDLQTSESLGNEDSEDEPTPSERRLEVRVVEAERLKMAGVSPDGRTVMTLDSNYEAHIWEFGTGRHLRQLEAEIPGNKVVFSADGSLVFGDNFLFESGIWFVETGEVVTRFGKDLDVGWSAAFSPDGRWVAVKVVHRSRVRR